MRSHPTYGYSPFGYAQGLETNQLSLGFNGELVQPTTAAYLLGSGYRAYSTSLMRFLSPDNASPFLAGGINPYAYCDEDPINKSDPSGQFAITRPARNILSNILKLFKKKPHSPSSADAPPTYHHERNNQSSFAPPPRYAPIEYSKKVPDGHSSIAIIKRKNGKYYPLPPSYQGNDRPDMRLNTAFHEQTPDVHDPFREVPAMEAQDRLIHAGLYLPIFTHHPWKEPPIEPRTWGSELLRIRS